MSHSQRKNRRSPRQRAGDISTPNDREEPHDFLEGEHDGGDIEDDCEYDDESDQFRDGFDDEFDDFEDDEEPDSEYLTDDSDDDDVERARLGVVERRNALRQKISALISHWPLVGVAFLCFCSGLAGLTYEVIWLRLLAAILGNASLATAAVLAAVMTGFGLGGLLVGRYADRTNPLRLYGCIEIALGFVALVVPSLATAVGYVSPHLLAQVGMGWIGGVIRFLLAALVVLFPACLMGATVPVLARFAELRSNRKGDVVGPTTGVLYGLNTAGAALGCALAGYFFLGNYGIRFTGALAAGLDLLVGAIALLLTTRVHALESTTEGTRQATPFRFPRGVVLILAALSGVCVLALEGIWTRVLLIVFGHDVHAFSSMLAVVLTGLALGAGAYGILPRRYREWPGLIPLLFTVLGVGALLSLTLVGRSYLSTGADLFALADAFGLTRTHEQSLIVQPIFTAALALAPSMAAGALLPALCAAYPANRELKAHQHTASLGAGSRVGRVFAANTLGALLGSLAPSLILIQTLGLQRAYVAIAAIAVGCALLALATNSRIPPAIRWAGGALAVSTLALAAASSPGELPRHILASKIGPRHLRFLLYEEGRTGTVAVVRNRINGERQLFINGVNEVTTRLVHDQSFKLLGHLGILLHPDPQQVLVICLGAGLSAGAVATHDIETLEIVDLERSVARAAGLFARENNNVLEDNRVSVTFDDGRNYLRVGSGAQDYDVIVVDSTHPRAVDSWILYTREFYETAEARLSSEGYFVQWLPMHGLSVDEFRIIVHTFLTVFPQGSLWVNVGFEQYGQAAYALLLGSREELSINVTELAERLEEDRIRRDLQPFGLHTVPEVLECFVAGSTALRRWTAHLPINTDDLPLTQFVTSYSHRAPMSAERLLEVRHPIDGNLVYSPGEDSALLRRRFRQRYLCQGFLLAGNLERAVQVCGDDCEKLPLFLLAYNRGLQYYLQLRQIYADDSERILEVAAGLQRLGRTDEAISALEEAVAMDRTNARLWLNLGIAEMGSEDRSRAQRALRSALVLNPDLVLARINLGLLEVRHGDTAEAITDLERAVELDSTLAEAQAALGYGLLHVDRRDEGEEHLRYALELDPRHRTARINLGRLMLSTNRFDAAVDIFRVGWRLYPYDSDMVYNLAVASYQAGRVDTAVRALEAAVHLNPEDTEARRMLEHARQALTMLGTAGN